MLKEVRFTFRHDNCWLLEATQRNPAMTLVVSSVYQVKEDIHVDLFVHAPSKTMIDHAFREWSSDKRIHKISKLYEGAKGTRYHVSYAAKNSIYPHIIHHTPLSLGAISMSAGIEYYSILGESEDVQGLLGVLSKEGKVEVQSIKNLQELPETKNAELDAQVLSGLTDKQVEALVFAHAKGYYNWPRVVSASELADMMGLSSAAFLDHLRRAEARAVEAVMMNLKSIDPARVEAIKARLPSGPKPSAAARLAREELA
jgi:predicted DNA binding protein